MCSIIISCACSETTSDIALIVFPGNSFWSEGVPDDRRLCHSVPVLLCFNVNSSITSKFLVLFTRNCVKDGLIAVVWLWALFRLFILVLLPNNQTMIPQLFRVFHYTQVLLFLRRISHLARNSLLYAIAWRYWHFMSSRMLTTRLQQLVDNVPSFHRLCLPRSIRLLNPCKVLD